MRYLKQLGHRLGYNSLTEHKLKPSQRGKTHGQSKNKQEIEGCDPIYEFNDEMRYNLK